jgi:PPOX class probable F420-dependent enzyme
MDTTLAPLRQTKTILLTTFRRNGTPVATPVSIAFDGDRAFFRTWNTAHKAKRLRNNPPQRRGSSLDPEDEPTGPAIPAKASMLEGRDARLAAKALARRHRFLQAVLVPIGHRLMRYRTMHYELRSTT